MAARRTLRQGIKAWFFSNSEVRQNSVIFEIEQDCNLRCKYCYNVWNTRKDYPRHRPDTQEAKRLITRIIEQTSCRLFTFTGGEPLLRNDLAELVQHANRQGVSCNLITNGLLLTPDRIRELVDAGVSLFETPLLGSDAAVAADLHGKDVLGRMQENIVHIKKHGGRVVPAFVACAGNINQVKDAAEIAFALGADGLMFNRFNPGGRGGLNAHELMPTPEQLRNALDTLDGCAREWGLGISCSIVIHPCIIDTSVYKNLSFGYCAAGTRNAYYAVDPAGNVRMCNHSPTIVGNLWQQPFRRIVRPANIRFFLDAMPDHCRPCAMAETCQGGCKAAAESCYESLCACEPYLAAYGREVLTEKIPVD